MVLDIYIAILLSGIFILQLHRAIRAAEVRRIVYMFLEPLLKGFTEGVEKTTKGEHDE